MAFKYFLYSENQVAEKNSALSKTGKEFVPGVIVVNGKRMRFSQLSDTSNMERYVDTKVVAKGETGDFTYTMPTTTIKSKN